MSLVVQAQSRTTSGTKGPTGRHATRLTSKLSRGADEASREENSYVRGERRERAKAEEREGPSRQNRELPRDKPAQPPVLTRLRRLSPDRARISPDSEKGPN